MRRTPLNKRGKSDISKLQKKLWELCKQVIRKKYPNQCYTCGAKGLEGSNWQTGHMWAKASLPAGLKYDLRVLRPQCMRCNIHMGGMGADYYKRMLAEIGEEKMAQLEKERQILTKADRFWYEARIQELEALLVEWS